MNKKLFLTGCSRQHEPNTQEPRKIVNQKLPGNLTKSCGGAGYAGNHTFCFFFREAA
jgi:hypothetical protein